MLQDVHCVGILKQWKLDNKWCDNHSYSRLMHRIVHVCELSNQSNKLKDTKANETREGKSLPRPYSLSYIFRFHLCLSCLIL